MTERHQLVLSLFPGLDLLGRGFGEEGATVVTGPDVVWGGDIRDWHALPGRFDGVIGGPPCQAFSRLAALTRAQGNEPRFGNLIPEFERVVAEAQPRWFVMEEVPDAPRPAVEGYDVWAELLRHNDLGGAQPRERRITFGLRAGEWASIASPFTLIEYDPARASGYAMLGGTHGPMPGTYTDPASRARRAQTVVGTPVVPRSARQHIPRDSSAPPGKRPRTGREVVTTSSGGRPVVVLAGNGAALGQRDAGAPTGRMSIEEMLTLQDAPPDLLDDSPFTMDGKRKLVGNAVPVLMARAIARMVWRTIEEVS